MQLKKLFLFFGMLAINLSVVSAQVIDNTSTFKTINNKSYFRFQYDNDYFTKTDYYYSQGVSFEYVHPAIKKFPLTKLLLKPAHSDIIYGIGFNIFGYTPTSIVSESILYGDRPYASSLSLKTFSAATDTLKRKRLSTAFSIGIIGPAAQGKEIQTNIHRWLKNILPRGWDNQIKNDVIINYQVNYEKEIMAAPGNFLLNGAGELRVGTLDDRLSAGINLMAGNFNDPYAAARSRTKKVSYYFYGQARSSVIGYDASMEGGFFNRKSPYKISAGDVKRATFQADAGIAVNFRKLYLSYSQSFITKEFKGSKNHRWGGINIGFSL